MTDEYNLNENDRLTLRLIKEHFEQLLKDNPLTPEQIEELNGLTEIQRFAKLLHFNLNHELCTKNKILYYSFLNLCVKCFQQEIPEIMKKMEIEPCDELTVQLQYATTVYSNILFLKKTLNF